MGGLFKQTSKKISDGNSQTPSCQRGFGRVVEGEMTFFFFGCESKIFQFESAMMQEFFQLLVVFLFNATIFFRGYL